MFKNINESFDKKFQDINNQPLITKLTECLNRLNEAEMSDEDKHDSELIRSMLNKIKARSNAKFSPEEQGVMDKYGITRDNGRKNLFVDDRGLSKDLDGKNYIGRYTPSYSNGTPSKINYADRARKLRQRKDSQVFPNPYSIKNDEINKHGPSYGYFDNVQDAERWAQDEPMRQKVRDMQSALADRKRAQSRIDNADSEREQRVSKAKADYDRAISVADREYEYDTVGATKSKKYAQGTIDKLLKRNQTNESKTINEAPVYDMVPQYDSRQSFYSKARVEDNGNEKTLFSYNTPVCTIVNGKVELLDKWDWSQTTLRHCKEFLKQNGFEATSLKQMRDTYL